MKTALTIAGSDPTGGAGLQSDLKTFHALGLHGLGMPSAITAQNTEGVLEIYEMPEEFFFMQLETLLKDIKPDAVKTGMLYSPEIVRIVATMIQEYSLKNLVIDPVMVSSTGSMLAIEGCIDVIKNELLPHARVITPNLDEAESLTGMRIKNIDDMKKAAVEISSYGVDAVIITGGHLTEKSSDLFYENSKFIISEKDIVAGRFHGTGCAFSAALTAGLASGLTMSESFRQADEFVHNAIITAYKLGKGMKLLNI